jgi:flagellar protein FliO/FliZ
VVLALLLVLAAVFAAGWLMRRLRVLSGTGSPGLEVLSQASLGARERAVLLRVGQQQLLLGVAAGSVRLLYQLPAPGGESAPVTGDNAVVAPGAPPNGAPPRPNFRELLKRSLGR